MSPADSPFAQLPAPGPHPAPAELRAYAAGTLSAADEHRIESHTLDCERCADLLGGFSMSDATTTDYAVAELRTRLQARLGAEEPTPVVGGWAWPRIAAAAALVAAVAGGIWTLEQHEAPTTTATARLETPASATSAASSALELPAALPPEVAAETFSKPEKTADYATVMPNQARHRTAASRASGRNNSSADDVVPRPDLADMKAAASSPSPAEEEKLLVPPAATSAAGYAIADAAPAKKSSGLLPGRAALDTATSLGEVMVASRMMKAKAAAPSTASALVANTPMPAGFAIKPAPVGGTPALRDYLRREASQFVPEINNLRISGTVRISLVVGADGKLSDIKVTRSLRPDYDEEALRLVCEGPDWQPGIAGGKRAPLPVELTVPF